MTANTAGNPSVPQCRISTTCRITRAVIGSISDESLFLTLPTQGLTVLLCLIGAVSSVAFAVGSPASADNLKSVVRTVNAIVNPEDAWRLEDQARRYNRPHEERYWRSYGAGLEQQRRERGEAVPPRGGWHQYSIPIDPDEAYRLQYQARRDGHINEDRYWARYREGLQHGPQR